MKNHSFLTVFTLVLTMVLGIVFGIHYGVLSMVHVGISLKLTASTYLLLYACTLLIVQLIYRLRKKFYHQIGFLFLVGSFLKFGLYFVYLKPVFTENQLTKPQAFLLFFIPYLISLILEAIYVAKLLRQPPVKE